MRVSDQVGGGIFYFAIKTLDKKNSSGLSNIAMGVIEITDTTAPNNISMVRDGTGQDDIDFTNSLTELSAKWDAASDPGSGIKRYWYAIGTIPGRTDARNWTDNDKNTTVTATDLQLTIGKLYYFSVKAENGAGLESKITSSDGVFITNLSPLSGLRVKGVT